MIPISRSTSDKTPSITPFELKALAFADMIMAEANNEIQDEDFYADTKTKEHKVELPAYEAIRCVCNNNQQQNGPLILCTSCSCYLHRDCVDPVEIQNPNTYKCPFCRLKIDGVDPFKDLKTWIDKIDTELKTIHDLFTDAVGCENQLDASNIGHEYQMPNIRSSRQGTTQMRNQLNRTVSDIIQHLAKITKM